MKTSFDASDILFTLVNIPEITGLISGAVYHQNSRPLNSQTEDVVVNTLSVGDTDVQAVVGNVNIYVPDVKTKGIDSFYLTPNRDRLKQITENVIEALNGTKGTYWTDGELHVKLISGPLPEASIKQHYVNIRVSIKLHANYN